MLLVAQNKCEAGTLSTATSSTRFIACPDNMTGVYQMCSVCLQENDHMSVGEKFNFLSPQDFLSAKRTLLPAFRKQRVT